MDKAIVESIFDAWLQTEEVVAQREKEAQRLYLAARVEVYAQKLDYLRKTIQECLDSELHHASPFMMGYVEGLRQSSALISGHKIDMLAKPTVWSDDPQTHRRIRLIQKYRREIRRLVTKMLWKQLCWAYQWHMRGSSASYSMVERIVRSEVMDILAAIPPSYKLKARHKKLLKRSVGEKYEKVKNARSIENWWH